MHGLRGTTSLTLERGVSKAKTAKAKKRKIPDFEIPFNKEGRLMSYATPKESGVGGWNQAHEWRQNHVFQRTLVFSEFERGRSAAHAIFIDPFNEHRFPMFLKDLADAIPHLVDGKLTGDFAYSKRGQNYATKYMGPTEPPEPVD